MPRGYTGVTDKETSETVKRGKRGRFEKGTKPGPGRPKGLLSKFTGDLKEAFLQAAQAAGQRGIAGYLYDQAIRDNPSPFMTGLAKLLPLMLEATRTLRSSSSACTTPAKPMTTQTKIRIPNNWRPRAYQMNVWRYLERGRQEGDLHLAPQSR